MFDEKTHEYILGLKRAFAIKVDELADVQRCYMEVLQQASLALDKSNKENEELKKKLEQYDATKAAEVKPRDPMLDKFPKKVE